MIKTIILFMFSRVQQQRHSHLCGIGKSILLDVHSDIHTCSIGKSILTLKDLYNFTATRRLIF